MAQLTWLRFFAASLGQLMIIFYSLEQIRTTQANVATGYHTESGLPELSFVAKIMWQYHFLCGGLLVDNHTVITAKHCVRDVPASGINVTLGNNKRHKLTEQKLRVQEVREHPEADVALLILASPAKLLHQPDMPGFAKCMPPIGYVVTAAGWGVKKSVSRSSVLQLQRIDVPLQDNALCVEQKLTMTPEKICASNTGPLYANVCEGDSGRLLLVREGLSEQWKLLGIISEGPCTREKPLNYTSFVAMPHVRTWLHDNMVPASATCGASTTYGSVFLSLVWVYVVIS